MIWKWSKRMRLDSSARTREGSLIESEGMFGRVSISQGPTVLYKKQRLILITQDTESCAAENFSPPYERLRCSDESWEKKSELSLGSLLQIVINVQGKWVCTTETSSCSEKAEGQMFSLVREKISCSVFFQQHNSLSMSGLSHRLIHRRNQFGKIGKQRLGLAVRLLTRRFTHTPLTWLVKLWC